MKRYFFLLGLFFLTSITFAQTNQEIRDYADHFLSAIGTFSPDPVMASAIGAAPDVAKRYISQRCNTQMLRIEDELTDKRYSIKRFNELMELYIRVQALDSAINGDSTPLLDFEKNKKTKMKQREKELKKKQREEENDDMDFWLGLLREEVNELNALKNQILQEGSTNLNLIKDNFSEVRNHLIQYKYTKDEMKNYKTRTSNLVVLGEDICNEATNLRTKIFDLSKVMKDGEKIINAKIDQAKTRAANCQSAEDGFFVKTSYQEAKDAFAISKKAKESALNYFKDIEIHLLQIKRFNAVLDSSYTATKNKPLVTDNKWHEKASDFLIQTTDPLEQLKSGIIENEAFPDKKKKLIEKIEKSKNFYIQSFPKHEEKFNQLIREVKSINLDSYRVNSIQLSDLQNEYNRLLDALLYNSPRKREIKNQFKIKQYAISCFSIKSTKKEKDKIEEVFFREFLLIKYNEQLVDGCVPAATEITQEDTTEKPDTTVSSVDPPTTATDTTATKTTDKSIFGGLAIGGSSEITVGSRGQFIALDGAGDPYPNQGGFTWINTREDLLVLSSSGGVTTGGTAFRAGSATIILKFDGIRAYKDIKIKAKKGIDTNGDISEGDLNGENQLNEKCYNLIDRITISLHSSNVENARIFTNRALALGCDINAAAVAELITNIEDNEREEQLQRDRAYAALEQKQLVEKRIKKRQNTEQFLNLLGEKLNDFSNANKPPAVGNDSNVSTNNPTNSSSSEKPDYMGDWEVTQTCIQDDEQKKLSSWTSRVGKERVDELRVGYIYSNGSEKGYISGDSFKSIYVPLPLPQGEIKVTREYDKVRTNHYHIVKRIVEITVNKNSLYGTITEYRKYYYTGGDAGVIKYTLKGKRK